MLFEVEDATGARVDVRFRFALREGPEWVPFLSGEEPFVRLVDACAPTASRRFPERLDGFNVVYRRPWLAGLSNPSRARVWRSRLGAEPLALEPLIERFDLFDGARFAVNEDWLVFLPRTREWHLFGPSGRRVIFELPESAPSGAEATRIVPGEPLRFHIRAFGGVVSVLLPREGGSDAEVDVRSLEAARVAFLGGGRIGVETSREDRIYSMDLDVLERLRPGSLGLANASPDGAWTWRLDGESRRVVVAPIRSSRDDEREAQTLVDLEPSRTPRFAWAANGRWASDLGAAAVFVLRDDGSVVGRRATIEGPTDPVGLFQTAGNVLARVGSGVEAGTRSWWHQELDASARGTRAEVFLEESISEPFASLEAVSPDGRYVVLRRSLREGDRTVERRIVSVAEGEVLRSFRTSTREDIRDRLRFLDGGSGFALATRDWSGLVLHDVASGEHRAFEVDAVALVREPSYR